MRTTITTRHFDISDQLRDRADTVLARLAAASPRPVDGSVILDLEGTTSTAEIRLHLAGGEVAVASGEGPDHRTALDRAEERLRRQLRKAAERPRRDRKPAPDVA